MRKLRWAMVLTLSLTATQTCALFYPRWERSDEFVIGLKCGMSSTEIQTYARQFAGCTTFAPDGPDLPTLVVQHGGTNINCFLEDDKLRAVQVTWISKPATRKTDEKRSLCG
jgi:hypothetical protein